MVQDDSGRGRRVIGLPARTPKELLGAKSKEDCPTLLAYVKARQETGPRLEWPMVSQKGTVKQHIENVSEFLHWAGVGIFWNEFTRSACFEGLPGQHRELDDGAGEDIAAAMQWLGMPAHKLIDYLHGALPALARERQRHPVREYLGALKWDGQERIDSWLTDYLKVERTAYTSAVGRLLLIGAVWRAMKPGCKFDYMVVLEGQQGAGKSSAWLALVPNPEWFGDDVTLGGKGRDSLEETTGRWIIECAELVGLGTRELEGVKAFLSRQVDRGRVVWGRKPGGVPRQFVVVGTTNQGEYLRDQTGARRFLPVYSQGGPGEIDVEGLRQTRDQLWAEALRAYEAGEKPALPRELWEAARVEQEERRIVDPQGERLGELLADVADGFVPTEELWKAVGKGKATREHRMKLIIADTMRQLGWALLSNSIRIVLPAIETSSYRSVVPRPRKRRGWVKGDDTNRVFFYDETAGEFVEHDNDGKPARRLFSGGRELSPEEAKAVLAGDDGEGFP